METGVSLQFYFWLKIHDQTMKCEQVYYRGAKAMNYFATNSMVYFGLLHANNVELVGTPY